MPRPPSEIKAIVADLQARRKDAQPTNKRTYGSVFKNPDHELSAGSMLEACGLKGHRIGGAQISPRHANFIENADGASSADAIALMTEARRRAWEQFGVELQHEVEFLGVGRVAPDPQVGRAGRSGEVSRVGEKVLQLPRRRSFDVLRFAPSGRSFAIGVLCSYCSPAGSTLLRARRPCSPCSRSRSRVLHRRSLQRSVPSFARSAAAASSP